MLKWSLLFSASGFTLNATSPPEIFLLLSHIYMTHTFGHFSIGSLHTVDFLRMIWVSEVQYVSRLLIHQPLHSCVLSLFVACLLFSYTHKKDTHFNPFWKIQQMMASLTSWQICKKVICESELTLLNHVGFICATAQGKLSVLFLISQYILLYLMIHLYM